MVLKLQSIARISQYLLIIFYAVTQTHAGLRKIWEVQSNVTLLQNIYTIYGYLPKDVRGDQLKLEFINASIIMRKIDPEISFVELDCRDARLCSILGFTAYPQIRIFRYADYLGEYKGPILKKDLVHFFRWFAKGGIVDIKNKVELKNLIDNKKPSVIAFFYHRQPKHPLYKIFKEVAVDDDLRYDVNFGFCFCSNIQLCKFLDQKHLQNDIVLFRSKMVQNQYEPSSLMYKVKDDYYSAQALKDWILRKKHGLVGIRTPFNEQQFRKPLIVTYFYFNYDRNPKQFFYWRNRILNVAKLFINDDLTFVISDKDEKFHHDFCGIEGIHNHTQYTEFEKPLVVIHTILKQKFVMKRPFSRENFIEFVQDFRTGRLQQAVLKSEPLPVTNKGLVKKVVAKSFVDMVYKNNKDSFLYFYAPWCGTCQDITELVEELGKTLQYEPVNIYKIDGTLNDVHDHVTVKGYPTFFFISKSDLHHPVTYTGPRKLQSIINFIANRSTFELHGFDRYGNDKIFGKLPKKVVRTNVIKDEL